MMTQDPLRRRLAKTLTVAAVALWIAATAEALFPVWWIYEDKPLRIAWGPPRRAFLWLPPHSPIYPVDGDSELGSSNQYEIMTERWYPRLGVLLALAIGATRARSCFMVKKP
jgi:hypothetical protein